VNEADIQPRFAVFGFTVAMEAVCFENGANGRLEIKLLGCWWIGVSGGGVSR
jgi:hypothetical protein